MDFSLPIREREPIVGETPHDTESTATFDLAIRERIREPPSEVLSDHEIEDVDEETATPGLKETNAEQQQQKKKRNRKRPKEYLARRREKRAENRKQKKREERYQDGLLRRASWKAAVARRKRNARNSWEIEDAPAFFKPILREILKQWSLNHPSKIFPANIAPRTPQENGLPVTVREEDTPLLPASEWTSMTKRFIPALLQLSEATYMDHKFAMETLEDIVKKRHAGLLVGSLMEYAGQQGVRGVIAVDLQEALKAVKELRPRGVGWFGGSDDVVYVQDPEVNEDVEEPIKEDYGFVYE